MVRLIGTLKIGSRQSGESQDRATHRSRTEVYRPPIDWSELTLAQTESGVVQNWILGGVLFTPGVPRSGTEAQNLNVRTVGQLTLLKRNYTLRAETIRHCTPRVILKPARETESFQS